MNETNEMWREVKEEQRAERARARDAAHGRLERLQKAGLVRVQWFTNEHCRIRQPHRRGSIQVDFWPGTGRWIAMGSGRSEGWNELMRYLDIPESHR